MQKNEGSSLSYNPGHNIWQIAGFEGKVESPQVKQYLKSSIADFVYELLQKLLNGFRYRTLGN